MTFPPSPGDVPFVDLQADGRVEHQTGSEGRGPGPPAAAHLPRDFKALTPASVSPSVNRAGWELLPRFLLAQKCFPFT